MRLTTFFFYGTLRPGQTNHFVYLHDTPGVVHLGPGLTVGRFTMLASGYPFVLPAPPVDRICGDVFRIESAGVVASLDRLEGHTGRRRGYRREILPVETDSGDLLDCWVYLYHGTPLAEPVPGGDWLFPGRRG